MLEEVIKQNTEAVIALTAAILQNGNGSAAPEKPIRTRRTKAEIKAEKEAKENQGTKLPPGPDLGLDTTTPTEPEITIETLRANGKRLVEASSDQKGLEKARELIKSYGVTTIDEVKPKDYSKLNAQFIKEAENWGKSEPNTQL